LPKPLCHPISAATTTPTTAASAIHTPGTWTTDFWKPLALAYAF
jgi:hypothetical protein